MFLPSVETAVSLVMAALPMLGERIAVVGQGLVGQLTAAVVGSMMPSIELTVFDVVDEKLSIGKQFFRGGASNVRFAGGASTTGLRCVCRVVGIYKWRSTPP